MAWLAALGLVCAIPAASAAGGTSGREISARVSNDCRLVVVLSTPKAETIDDATWILQCPRERPRELGRNLSALLAVDTLLPSPDGRFLAVLSHGEGHPWLEVVDLHRLLDRGRYAVLREVNPYPGTIVVEHWLADALVVRSDMPLDQADAEHPLRADQMLDQLRGFRLLHDGWRIVPER